MIIRHDNRETYLCAEFPMYPAISGNGLLVDAIFDVEIIAIICSILNAYQVVFTCKTANKGQKANFV
jgi:hypothetical protein